MATKNRTDTLRSTWVDSTTATHVLTGVVYKSVSDGSFLQTTSINVVSGGNKNWRYRLRREPVLTGELYATVRKTNVFIERPYFRVEYLQFPFLREQEGMVTPNVSNNGYDPTLIDKAMNEATRKILRKYHAEVRSVQGLVSLGEVRETLRLLRRPTDLVAALTRRYIKRRDRLQRKIRMTRFGTRRSGKGRTNALLKMQRLLDQGVSEYLGYMYGIMPLVGDIESAAEYMNNINERVSKAVVLNAKGETKALVSGPLRRVQDVAGGFKISWTHMATVDAIVKLRGGFTATVGPSATMDVKLRSLITSAVADARNIVPALWELLPLSFIADYFSNIGDVINGWAFGDVFPLGLQQTKITKMTDSEKGYVMEFTPTLGIYPNYYGINPHGEYQTVEKSISRIKLPSLPVPTLTFELPHFKNDAKQYRNIAALVYSRVRKAKANDSENFWGQGVDL